MSSIDMRRFRTVPLSMQREGEVYVVGRVATADFYQIPDLGVSILTMLKSGETKSGIKSRLPAEQAHTVDVDSFVDELHLLGLIYPEDGEPRSGAEATTTGRQSFGIGRKVARVLLSAPLVAVYAGLSVFALFAMIHDPRLRLNPNAFYIEKDRTAFFILVTLLSFVLAILHESGHMIAAARRGIPSRFGIGTRLWTIVAEVDITGIFALPKSQRYFPMLAGMLVDIICIALLTIILQILLGCDASRFTVRVVQAIALSNALGLIWQFNIFVKTDIYYLICNHFSYSDLDRDARRYISGILNHLTLGRLGAPAPSRNFRRITIVRLFSSVWLFGRALSLATLFCVFLPTMWRYFESVVEMLQDSSASVWQAVDTGSYLCLVLTMFGAGTYMWLKQR
jgi:putative peptide zinc metalloprotease protein